MTEHWYRIEDYRVSLGCDEWGDPVPGSRLALRVWRLKVLHHTPKGVRLQTPGGNARTVLHASRKRYACATWEEAVASFKARKAKERSIYLARAQRAADAYDAVDQLRCEDAVGPVTTCYPTTWNLANRRARA